MAQRPPSADDVKALQEKYQAERAQVVKEGSDRRSLPVLLERADDMARKADLALKTGRLYQASEGFRQARWQLPYQPPDTPDHIARILGSTRLRHQRDITDVAYSPDGKFLATASSDETVKLWDLGSGREVLTYAGHAERVRHVRFTADGKHVVSAGQEQNIKVWESATGKDVATIKGEGSYVSALALSRDGKYVAAGHVNQAGNATPALLCVYETLTGKRVRTDSDFRANILSLNFNPAGTLLAAGDAIGQVRLWQFPHMVDNDKLPAFWSQQDPSGPAFCVLFTPDSGHLVRCGHLDIKVLAVALPGAPLQVSNVKRTLATGAPQLAAAFSRDGKILYSGGTDANGIGDGLLRTFDLESGVQTGVLKGHTGTIHALAFSPNGSQLASASTDYAARLWDFDVTLQAHDYAGHEGIVWTASFSPDGTRLVSASADKTVKLWEAATNKVLLTLTGHTSPVTTALFSPDGKLIASAGGDRAVRLWDADTGKLLRTCEGHQATVTALDFAADGKRLLSGSADRTARVWEVESGKQLQSLEQPSVVAAVAFRPDGTQLALGCIDGSITLHDGTPRVPRWTAHGGAVTCLAFSPNGQTLASGGVDQVVALWPMATPGEGALRLPGHAGPVSMVAFRRDNQHLASCGADQLVKLWKIDGNAGKETQTFRGHKDWVTSVAFSRDGFHLASSSVDKLVKVWEITSRDIPLTSEHTSAVETVAFSPDGKVLLTGSGDASIKVWNPASGEEVATLSGHDYPVLSLAFAPDGKTFVSSGADRALRLWQMSPPREVPRTAEQMQTFAKLRRYSPYIFLDPAGSRLFVWLPVNEPRVSTIVECYELKTGRQVFTFMEDNRKVNSLAFCADGKLAATGAKDGSVRLWDLDKNGTPRPGGDWFLFDKTGVADLALTPDGKTLVATNDNGGFKIADVEGRKVRHEKQAHEGKVLACVASPDGKRFATVGTDNVVKLWDTATGAEQRRWNMGGAPKAYFVVGVAFSPDSRQLVTANANTTAYVLDLP